MDCTHNNNFLNEVPVQAIEDTSSSSNSVSAKFLSRLKLPSDLIHSKQYGTAGEHGTLSQGAYSAIPLQFGKIVVSYPAVVLPNQTYKMIIGTLFLKEYRV